MIFIAKVESLNEEIDLLIVSFDKKDELRRPDEILGVGLDVAQVVLTEIAIST